MARLCFTFIVTFIYVVKFVACNDARPAIDNTLVISEPSEINLNGRSFITGFDSGINSIPERDIDADDNDYEISHSDKIFSFTRHPGDHSVYSAQERTERDRIQNENASTSKHKPNKLDDEDDPLNTTDYAEREWLLMFRELDLSFSSFSDSIMMQLTDKLKLFDDIIERLKPECKRDIYHIRKSAKRHKMWALRMLDSFGKIPSGVTYGRFSSPGDFGECLSVKVDDVFANKNGKHIVPEHYKFHGKYCLLDFRLPLPERPRDTILSNYNPVVNLSKLSLAEQFPDLKNYSGFASVFYEIGYLHGICLPSSCEIEDLVSSINIALDGMHLFVNNTIDCEEMAHLRNPWSMSQIISFAFIGGILLNAMVATLLRNYATVDTFTDHKQNELKPKDQLTETRSTNLSQNSNEPERKCTLHNWKKRVSKVANKSKFYTDCFSIQTNFWRLTKPDPKGITSVHYIRLVAMALTIITHTGALGTLQAFTKPADATKSEGILRDFLPQMLANAYSTIQIFFFLAGLLLVISTLPSIERNKGRLSFLEYAVKRAIRLWPGLSVTICLNFLWPLFVEGPMLTYFIRLIVEPCEHTWWHTLAFISNYDDVEKLCLRHSYFSASDYQLHMMAFPLLILLHKAPALSLILSGIFIVAGFAAQVIMVLTKPIMPFMSIDYMDKNALYNGIHYLHHPVWNHASAFFYGFIVGYLVIKQIRFNLSPQTVKRIWWIISPLGFVSVFAPYFWNHYKRPMTRGQAVIYILVDRIVLLTFCAWLSYTSMVLARPPRKERKPLGDGETKQPVSNQEQKVQQPATNMNQAPSERFAENDSNKTNLRNLSFPVAKMTRTISSSNVTSTLESVKQSASSKKADRSLSNVNILCLVLSRLTFQLYLFNMLVLWIDVNHSKYYWYFSYYFIITKSFAIYTCSALLAVTFYVTLESPCLSLYLSWIMSRQSKGPSTNGHDQTQNTNIFVNLKELPGNGLTMKANSRPASTD